MVPPGFRVQRPYASSWFIRIISPDILAKIRIATEARAALARFFTKALKQDLAKPGPPDAAAFAAFNTALTGPTALNAMPGGILGASLKRNGPLGAFAAPSTSEASAQLGSVTVTEPPTLST